MKGLCLRATTVHGDPFLAFLFAIKKSDFCNKASNATCRGELGRFSLIVGISEKILNYIMYLL